MIELKNKFPFTKSWFHNGKDFIFKAYESRFVPGDFVNEEGQIRYPGLELVGVINSEGVVETVVERKANANQEYVFIFEKDGKVYETPYFTDFCEEHKLNPTSIRLYIKTKKPYKGWNISRRNMTDKEKVLLSNGVDFKLWKFNT